MRAGGVQVCFTSGKRWTEHLRSRGALADAKVLDRGAGTGVKVCEGRSDRETDSVLQL